MKDALVSYQNTTAAQLFTGLPLLWWNLKETVTSNFPYISIGVQLGFKRFLLESFLDDSSLTWGKAETRWKECQNVGFIYNFDVVNKATGNFSLQSNERKLTRPFFQPKFFCTLSKDRPLGMGAKYCLVLVFISRTSEQQRFFPNKFRAFVQVKCCHFFQHLLRT